MKDDDKRPVRKLDLTSAKPTGIKPTAPLPKDVEEITHQQGFSSRESEQPQMPIRRRRGGRRKGRDVALSIRVTPKMYNTIVQICDNRNYGYAEFLEEALKAWDNKNR